jgi:2'-hydroxyisoflavone reductase
MDVLVIGGSVFVGRAVVSEALAAGASVTVFNRGRSGSAPDGAEQVIGDRTNPDDLAQLADRRFDVVIDTCGYVPAEVDLSAKALAATSEHYVLVSSLNAYPSWPAEPDYWEHGVHDSFPDATRDDVADRTSVRESYGWLKVGCERSVARAFGADRCTVLRAGCIVGPNDREVGRLPYWIDRVARGGEVLVPGPPTAPVAVVDARDLARFALAAAPGTFDVPGPSERDTRADLMAACLAVTGSDATFTYVTDEDWLAAQGVAAWTELPLWLPAAEGPGAFTSHTSAARAAGLRWRPLAVTVADTWAWQQTVAGGWHPDPPKLGLAPDRERELLAAWHSGTAP